MALFRRIRSPRDQPHILADQDGPEERFVVESNRSRSSQKGQPGDHKHHRRTTSDGEGGILQASEPSGILLNPPPQLPPRNPDPHTQHLATTGLGYRRTQSGGNIMLKHKNPLEGSDTNADTYFVPADTIKSFSNRMPANPSDRSSTQTLQEARNQQMFDKIMAHNDPVLQANMRSHSTDNLVDISEYSVPFRTDDPSTQAPSKRPQRNKQRHSTTAVRSEPRNRRLSHPPNFAPPPPPSAEGGEERLSSVSPISPSARNTDYDAPWDSNKFQLHKLRQGSGRQHAESSPHSQAHPVPHTPPPCGATSPPNLDERHGSHTPPDHHHSSRKVSETDQTRRLFESHHHHSLHKTSETEQPRKSSEAHHHHSLHKTFEMEQPRRPSEVHHHHSQHHVLKQHNRQKSNSDSELVSGIQSHSSPLPPLPPRNPQHDPALIISGESDHVEPPDAGFSFAEDDLMHDYVIPPDAGFSSAEDDLVHDYVIPPDATSSSSQDSVHEGPPVHEWKGHRYPPLLPGPTFRHNYMYPPDPRSLPPPAYIINTLLPLENQPWYHGNITRDRAESILRDQADFSFLVRKSETSKMDYSLSIRDKTSPVANGFVHLRISRSMDGSGFVLGQFSSPFPNVCECIAFYTHHQLTIKDIKHRRLGFPVSKW